MTKTQQAHLADLIQAAVNADSRNDAASRDRAKSTAVIQFAYCTEKQWDRRFRAATASQGSGRWPK